MPNWCDNEVIFDCSEEEFDEIVRPLLAGEDSDGERRELTLNALVTMPDDIFLGNIGEKERELYGENNWYDWRIANWGCKWDAREGHVDCNRATFITPWSPPEGWYRALAYALEPYGITAHVNYYVEGGFPESLGGIDLKDGELIESEADPEFAERYEWDEDEDEEEE